MLCSGGGGGLFIQNLASAAAAAAASAGSSVRLLARTMGVSMASPRERRAIFTHLHERTARQHKTAKEDDDHHSRRPMNVNTKDAQDDDGDASEAR